MIQIPAVIRPALSTELFGANDTPYRNALFFSRRKSDTKFFGPYHVVEHVNQDNFIDCYIFRELYVIVTAGEGFSFLMNLRVADKDDMLDGAYLRVNYLYYVKESDEVFDGPYFLKNDTDPYKIAALINKNMIYVVAEEQSFTPFSLEKSA
jgi:hypothetical protein